MRDLGHGAPAADLLDGQDADAVFLAGELERQELLRVSRIEGPRVLAAHAACGFATPRSSGDWKRVMTPGISRISATRPSPSMVAPASPVTCLKLVSRLLMTTCCCDMSSSTKRPTRLPSASTIMSRPSSKSV